MCPLLRIGRLSAGSHAGSHTDEQPSGATDSPEQREAACPTSRTDLNGSGCPHGYLRIYGWHPPCCRDSPPWPAPRAVLRRLLRFVLLVMDRHLTAAYHVGSGSNDDVDGPARFDGKAFVNCDLGDLRRQPLPGCKGAQFGRRHSGCGHHLLQEPAVFGKGRGRASGAAIDGLYRQLLPAAVPEYRSHQSQEVMASQVSEGSGEGLAACAASVLNADLSLHLAVLEAGQRSGDPRSLREQIVAQAGRLPRQVFADAVQPLALDHALQDDGRRFSQGTGVSGEPVRLPGKADAPLGLGDQAVRRTIREHVRVSYRHVLI